jgi:hypothetical protein
MTLVKPREIGSAHEAMAALVDRAGGAKKVADFEGVSIFTLYKMLDPDQPKSEASFVRIARWSQHFQKLDAAHYLARLVGCVLVRLPDVALSGTRLGRLTGQAMKETADVFATLGDALDDSELTPAELVNLERQIDEAQEKLEMLRLQARAEVQGAE